MKAFFKLEPSQSIGFPQPLKLLILTALSMGGLLIIISLVFHSRIPTRYLQETINQKQPRQVLLTAAGSPENPGFIGFLIIIQPDSNVLTIVPIPGSLTTRDAKASNVPVSGLPLWEAVSQTPPKTAVHLIEKSAHINVTHYFFLTANDLQSILNALYTHAQGWPQTETVPMMLNTLGFPKGDVVPAKELKLLREIMRGLPKMNPLVASSLIAITKTAKTNLSGYQMFQLANYIRGDSFKIGQLTSFQVGRNHHGQ